jgi:hypothetical protein
MSVHIWNELKDEVLGPEDVSRAFQRVVEHGYRAASHTLYLPALNRFASGIQLSDVVTAQDAVHLEGYRIIAFGAYGKLLEITRHEGRISSSQELPRNVSPVQDLISQFFSAVEWAVADYVRYFPYRFPESEPAILYTPQLLRTLLIQSMTGEQRPFLIPRVRVPRESVKPLARELSSQLPFKLEGPTEPLTLRKEAAGYHLHQMGERGESLLDETFTDLEPAVYRLFSTLVPLERDFASSRYQFNPSVFRRPQTSP